DLPMALGILASEEQVPREVAASVLAAGELSLGGALRPVRGALSLAMLARDLDRPLLLPRASAAAASLVPGVRIVAADTLGEVVAWMQGELELPPVSRRAGPRGVDVLDLADVRGQELARRALEIAAAGAHHLWMSGPPG